jgi:TolA-binding protein
LLCTSCSSFTRRNQEAQQAPEETDAQKIERLQVQNKELSGALTALNAKLDTMASKLASVNDKLEASSRRMDNVIDNQRAKPGPVKTLPTEGAAHLPPAGDDDAEAAFTANEPVRKYRQAMILFQSHNYPDASLGFSAFVDQYPDHALAGSAQFFLGESYFKQKEYKLAARELGRVITTYDRSPHIAETLRDLSISEAKTGMPEEAARHRQLLTSLFPHSPAAHTANEVDSSSGGETAEAPEGSNARVVISPKASAEEGHTAESQDAAHSQIDSVPATAEKAPAAPTTPAAHPAQAPSIDAPPPTAPMAPSGPAEPENR